MSELTIALVATSFGFGVRHGIDWDHIAAIGDIASGSPDRRTAFELSTLYAFAHGLVVVVLGGALIAADFSIGHSLDQWFGRLAGATVLLLGAWVLVDLRQRGEDYRLRSRAMLVMQTARARGSHAVVLDEQDPSYGRATATGIGVIHGVGIETPTQIALFVAATHAVGRASGMALLGIWVLGLVLANTAVALATSYGMHNLGSLRRFHIGAGFVVGVGSVVLGTLMMVGADGALPALT